MDIDIDIDPRADLTALKIVKASMLEHGKIKKHPVGAYFQNIATDPDSSFAAIPFKEAEELGYYKIDLLHLNLLKYFESRDEVLEVLDMPVDWSMLKDPEIVSKLFHIKKHYELVVQCSPVSIEDLADILAMIRPNKINLKDKYIKNKNSVRELLYEKHDESDLRKSHAIAYAMNIVIQMNLIKLGAEF